MKIARFGRGTWGTVRGDRVWVTVGPGGRRTGRAYSLDAVRLLAPARPTKIVGVGRNYRDHIREMGHPDEVPAEPGLFLVAPNALAAPEAAIPYPEFTRSLHYEGELAVVVGARMRSVPARTALRHVLGYTCALDLTARDRQKSDLQWVRAKSADGFLPLGPWVETDLDPQHVSVRTRVNGELRQDGRTEDMIFPVAQLLAYISAFMTLEPGDVVLTGTPAGVGELHPGDRVEVTVDRIGTLNVRIA